MYQRQTSRPGLTERGAALVVSLILLLIMTIIGVAAMNGARLEVRMAGMMQREEVALRGAEQTLAAAERYTANTTIGDCFDPAVPGCYPPGSGPDVSQTDWSGFGTIKIEEDARGEFVVEYLDSIRPPNAPQGYDVDNIPGNEVKIYRISARSETEGNAVRIVESIYIAP